MLEKNISTKLKNVRSLLQSHCKAYHLLLYIVIVVKMLIDKFKQDRSSETRVCGRRMCRKTQAEASCKLLMIGRFLPESCPVFFHVSDTHLGDKRHKDWIVPCVSDYSLLRYMDNLKSVF